MNNKYYKVFLYIMKAIYAIDLLSSLKIDEKNIQYKKDNIYDQTI